MEALPIDIQSLIWQTYHTHHVIPRLPTQRELWDKRYTDKKLLRTWTGVRRYDESDDVTLDVMMMIDAEPEDYEVGSFALEDASVRRGLVDYIRSHRNGKDLDQDDRTLYFGLLRDLTYSLLHTDYEYDTTDEWVRVMNLQ